MDWGIPVVGICIMCGDKQYILLNSLYPSLYSNKQSDGPLGNLMS